MDSTLYFSVNTLYLPPMLTAGGQQIVVDMRLDCSPPATNFDGEILKQMINGQAKTKAKKGEFLLVPLCIN